jgi:hypothetical protein
VIFKEIDEMDNMTERVALLGVMPDGSSKVIGTVPTPPAMKRRDIVRDYFGETHGREDVFDDASLCLSALNDYHEWLVAQGWEAPPFEVKTA